ncbi:MAG: MFS transporter [Gammaproteobacteria bacterium]
MTNSNTNLRFSEKLGYGLGDGASNFFFQVFNLFLLYYYTDVFGLSPAAVGTMFLVTKIVDTITDPMMGIIADRTQTRWGKFRPYLLWMAIPYGFCGYLMFANPELSNSGKLIYAYVTYTLMMLAYTAINVPYSALMGVISSSSIERTKVSSYRFFCAFLAGWAISTLVPTFKDSLGDGDEALAFQILMGAFAVVSISMFWICFATTKERVAPMDQPSDLRADFRALIANGPWLVLFVAAIFTLMSVAIRAGGTMYYFKYFVGSGDETVFWIFNETSVFLSLGTLGMLVGITGTRWLVERFEKRNLLIVLSLLNAASFVAFFFVPPEAFWTMVVINVVGSVINGPTPALVWAMYADTADYGEWKSGRRTTGLVFSAVQFAQKFGLAIGAALSGYILAFYGFVANQDQSDEALLGIRLMFTIFPALLSILATIAVWFYRLDRETLSEIEASLARTNEASPPSARHQADVSVAEVGGGE